jgi:ACS family pantothenate transporter-like MFS transporter
MYGLLPTGILAFWPKSLHLKEFAFLTTGVQLMTAVLYVYCPWPEIPSNCSSYTFANEICAGDNEERALVLSSMNGLQYAVCLIQKLTFVDTGR